MNSVISGRILIVDDDIAMLEALRDLFVRYHFYVRTATCENDALREIEEDRFDVVVSDWVMPFGGGRTVIKEVHLKSPNTFVIIHSAFDTSDLEATIEGADAFVEKTHQVEVLRNAVERGIRVSRSRWVQHENSELAGGPLCEAIYDTLKIPRIANSVSCEYEPIAFGVAHRAFVNTKPKQPYWVLDCQRTCENGQDRILFGGTGRIGALGTPVGHTIIIRNAQLLAPSLQERIMTLVNEQVWQRTTQQRKVPANAWIACTFDNKENTKATSSFRSFFCEASEIRLPSIEVVKSDLPVILERTLLNATNHNIRIGGSIRVLCDKFPNAISWETLHWASLRFPNLFLQENQFVEIEDLGIPVLESSLTKLGVHGEDASWQEFAKITKLFYVCRMLSKAGGNITEASRLSGMTRTQIYKLLDEIGVSGNYFAMS